MSVLNCSDMSTDPICTRCAEPILDKPAVIPRTSGALFAHNNCALRSALGSVAHLERRCSCFVPGSTAGDPEAMTMRQAADAAVAVAERHHLEVEVLLRGGNPGPPRCDHPANRR